jgi:adenosylmethionine-8-amino-7-oxononanoate aminotransferase
MFACDHAKITPDILCLGKALTGGYMTLAATLCTEQVALGVCEGEPGVFMHGPTFMGNPLACAVAKASIEQLRNSDWQANVKRIEQQMKTGLLPLAELDIVEQVRCLGAIGVVELKQRVDVAQIQKDFIKKGAWIRPFGKLVYIMPPFVCSNAQIDTLTNAISYALHKLAGKA